MNLVHLKITSINNLTSIETAAQLFKIVKQMTDYSS